jgi:hypothetical protein
MVTLGFVIDPNRVEQWLAVNASTVASWPASALATKR